MIAITIGGATKKFAELSNANCAMRTHRKIDKRNGRRQITEANNIDDML